MIPAKVVMKATFERAGEIIIFKPSPLQITDKSSFIPPDDVVEMLEKRGNDIVVEQTLDIADFNLLFRDMSKYFAIQPEKELPVAGMPKSLLNTCGNVVTDKLTARYVVGQPAEISEVLARNLPPAELADFVMYKTTLYSLKNQYSVDGLQRFLLHFLKTYSRTDLPDYVKAEMKMAKKRIKSQCYKLSVSNKSSKREHSKYCHIDWTIVALGCFHQFLSCAYSNSLEYIFFLLKFRQQQHFIRSPVPQIPFCLSRLIPQHECLMEHLTTLDDEDLNTRVYRPRETKHEEFMVVMTAIAENAWRGAHHEVLAYAALALCNDEMHYNPYWRKYYFFVWGEVAVSLAKLNMPETFAHSCLANMSEFALNCVSFELDTLLYKQKVASAYRQCEQEKKYMKMILSIAPKHSRFYRNSVLVHLSSRKREFENMLAYSYTIRKDESGVLQRESAFDRKPSQVSKFEDSMENQLMEYKKFLHTMCATFGRESKMAIFRQHLVLVDLYDILLSFLKCGWKFKADWARITSSLATTTCDERHFASFHNDDLHESMYSIVMSRLKKDLSLQTKVVNHQVWANVCFTHFLFLTIVDCKANIVEYFRQEALQIYQFHNNSHRKTFLMENVAHNFNMETCKEEPKIEKPCTIQWILRNAPNVKQLVRLGISSAARFDTWAFDFNWQPMN